VQIASAATAAQLRVRRVVGQAGPLAEDLPPGQVGGRHGRDPKHGRQRPQPGLADAEHLTPEPGQDVVERRGRLGARDLGQHVAEPAVDHLHGVGLVEPVALVAYPPEPQDGGQYDDRGEQP
jgi:hypothetical protein